MPASSSSNLTYTLTGTALDMANHVVNLTFTVAINANPVNTINWQVSGQTLAAIMGVPGDNTLSRHDDLLTAFYNAAVTAGIISGAITLP